MILRFQIGNLFVGFFVAVVVLIWGVFYVLGSFLHIIRKHIQATHVNVHCMTQFVCHYGCWFLKLVIYGSDMPL